MKKQLLFAVFFLTAFLSSYAQFEVRDYNTNALITDGQELAFSDSGCGYSDPCNWKFKVTNTSASPIYMRIFVDGMENTDGSNFQLCFAGVCLNSVSLGSGYPTNAAMIAAGATNGIGNNMWNLNPAGTTTEMSWTFRFQALDASNNPIGTPISMTYRYSPSLSIEESSLDKVDIYPTVTNDVLNIKTQENLTVTIYNLLGRKVKEFSINSGLTTVDISKLSSQPYLVRFSNKENQYIVKKIIIK